MTLGEQQRLFCSLIGKFIVWVYTHQRWALTFGEAHRGQQQAEYNAAMGIGILNSLHMKRLAVDFNFFVDGVWQIKSESYKPLGDYWKSLHPLCRWGGDFKKPDGNHFSMEWNGVK